MTRFLSEKTNHIIIIVFIFLSLPLLLNHEPWRDEGAVWVVVRDIPNVTSFIQSRGYAGHPALWYLILFPFVKLGLPYFSMAIVHYFMILSAVSVFLSYAPFSHWHKTLFVFGYFIFYEYSIIARNYALSVLLLFLIARIYQERFQKPISYSLLLLLLANTHVYCLNFSIVLGGMYIFESTFHKNIKISKKLLVSFFVILCGILLSIYQLLPPADLRPEYAQWNLELTLQHIRLMQHALIGAVFPIPYPSVNFWTSKLVYNLGYPSYLVMQLGSPLIFFLSLGFFIKKPEVLVIYILSTTSLFGIFAFKYFGTLRHHGLLFIIFIFCLWISQAYDEKILTQNKLISKLFNPKNLAFLLSILLCCHVVASPIAAYYELRYDFSAGKKTAIFLKDDGFLSNDVFIAIYPSYLATSILPYIPKPHSQFYFLEYQIFRSFMIWNTEYYNSRHLSIPEIVDRVDNVFLNSSYSTALLILNWKVSEKEFYESYNLIVYFTNTIVSAESFYIYELKN